MKNIILRILITIIIVLLIILSSYLFPLISSILIILLILYEVFFNKIINKLGFTKTLIISLIPIFILIINIFVNNINSKIERINKWNNIKNDYELINDKVIKYYNDNCNLECSENKSIVLTFSSMSNDIESTDEEKKAIEKIKNYYRNQDFVRIEETQINYTDDSGYFVIIYSRNNKRPKLNNRSIKHIKGNWYLADTY